MQIQNSLDDLTAQAELLRADLAAVLESHTRLEEHDKPILQARYLSVGNAYRRAGTLTA
jgi:hypothetical protein